MVNRTEEIEQARVIKWSHKITVRAIMPQLKWLHHSANGGKRSAFTGAQMKALGVKPGFPDLILPVKTSISTGLVIEMKSAKGKLSAEQSEWIDHFIENDWQIAVLRSAEDARRALCNYLGINPEDAPPLD